MMTDAFYVARHTTLVSTAPMCSVVTMKTLVIFPKGCPDRIPLSGTPCRHDRSCSWTHYNHSHKDPSPLTTDAAKEETSTSQDPTTNPNTTEALATIRGMHPAPHPTSVTACNTHQLTDTPGNTLTWTHHTSTAMTHLRHGTFPVGVTLETIQWTKVNLVQDTLPILPTDYKQRRHWNHFHEQQPLRNLTTRRRSPFWIHNWTLLLNQIMTLIL